MQYLVCIFDVSGRQLVYHNDGPPASVGNRVTVPTRGAPGATTLVTVQEIVAEPPGYATAAILGIHEE